MAGEDRFPVLMITELFLPTKGGTAVSFDDDFRRLGGKEVQIITADVPGAAEFDRDHPNSIHRLKLARRVWLKPESLLIYTKFFLKSLSLAFTRKLIGVFAGRVLPEGFIALVIGRMFRKPVLVYAHGEELTSWGRGKKFKALCYVMRHADWIMSNSDHTRDTLINLIGVTPDKIAVIYPTVDEHRFRPGLPGEDLRASIGLAADDKLILSVGRLQRRKGFDTVIRTLRALQDSGKRVDYALIGIGNDQEHLRNLAGECGVSNHVHFLGHVSYEDLPRWYSACDVFAMPNRNIDGDNEGFGLVFLEAAAAGKPAVAGTAGGTASAVADGVTGLRVEGENLDAVQQALLQILSNPESARNMGAKARERVIENFTHDRRVNQMRDLLLTNSFRAP